MYMYLIRSIFKLIFLDRTSIVIVWLHEYAWTKIEYAQYAEQQKLIA